MQVLKKSLPIIAGLLSAWVANAQWVAFGVTGGVPISPHSVDYGAGELYTRTPQFGPNDLYTKPYTLGPVLDVNLPWRLAIETGALYARLHKDVTTGLITGHGNPGVNFGYREDLAANAWDFPFLLKYRFAPRRFTPYAGAGATLRHQGDFKGQGVQVDFFLQPNPATFQVAADHNPQVAVTFVAGADFRYRWLNLSPEMRFLHWTALAGQPVQNQAVLMLRITGRL